jgi:hypothetical protein
MIVLDGYCDEIISSSDPLMTVNVPRQLMTGRTPNG